MRKATPFACPKCGSEVLIGRIKIKSASDFDIAACKQCGYAITEKDFIERAQQAVERMLGEVTRRNL